MSVAPRRRRLWLCINYTDDEMWYERLRKRLRTVAVIKSGAGYLTPWVVHEWDMLLAPNAYDRDCSKREWVRRVRVWQEQLRRQFEVSQPPPSVPTR